MKLQRCWVLATVLMVLAVWTGRAKAGPDGLLYRLEEGSTLIRGCFDPCLCPIYTTESLRGTFELVPTDVDPLFAWFDVRDVNLVVDWGGKATRLTGEGVYRVGGEVVVMHELILKLEWVVDGQVEELFLQSGLVPGGNTFDITVSVNGMFCFDTVLDMMAEPVPESEIVRYSLESGQFVQTCFDPCDCFVHNKWPLVGTFGVVAIGGNDSQTDYAVVDIEWKALAAQLPGMRFSGHGLYSAATFTDQHRLMLTIDSTGLPRERARFDSGWQVQLVPAPVIEIAAAENGFFCLDHYFEFSAVPRD